MKRLSCLLLALLMLVSTAVSAGHVTPIEDLRPAALMAYAWSAPYHYDPAADPTEARLDGQCCGKVAWVIQQLGRGQMVVGYRNLGHGECKHAALLLDGVVYDVDGTWTLEAYGRLMVIEEIV